jgi:hypothetical protein
VLVSQAVQTVLAVAFEPLRHHPDRYADLAGDLG